jgi:hypothetical protein
MRFSMKKARLERNSDPGLFTSKLSTILKAVFAVAMVGMLVLLVWQKSTQRLVTADYDGRIVDRWADYTESQQVSEPRFRLLIESKDGKRFTVKVDANVFESTKIGMRIKSRSGQVVLIEADKE